MIGLDDLRKVLLSEREAGKLLQMAPDFFDRAHASLHDLRKKVADSEDPFSDDVQKMILETRSISETLSDLFAIRTGKILSLAENQAQGFYIDREEEKKMVPQEREMYDRIVSAVRACQDTLVQNTPQTRLPVHAGTVQEKTAEPAAASEEPAAPAEIPEPEHPNPPQPARKPAAPEKYPYALVRVLADMDTFMGIDGKTYELVKGDIVMLPERNAEVLVERNMALTMEAGSPRSSQAFANPKNC